MALRLGGLADLDPSAVPLPPGTEVVTRVDRIVDGEPRPQGATGRVAALEADGERVVVAFVDGKRATYLRAEVTPRKLGVAIRWLGGEPPEVRVSEALRPTLVAIKRGEVPMTEVLRLARELTPKLEAARQRSPLPRHADVAHAERVLREIREESARRWVAREA